MNGRSLAHDESVRRISRVPPDKAAGPKSDSRRLDVQVVNKETETSVTARSPESEGLEPSLVQPDAATQQPMIRRASELSEHSKSVPWPPGPVLDEANSRWQQNLPAVSNVESNMNSRSPVPSLSPLAVILACC